jgi:WD40 repeat protein
MGIECKISNIILPKPSIEYSNVSRPVFCGGNNNSIIYAAKDTVCIQPLINHGNNNTQGGTEIHLCSKYDVNERNNQSVLILACMSPNGRIVVAGDTNGILYIWRYQQDKDPLQKWVINEYLGNARHEGNCIKDFAFTPDSNYLAVVGLNGGVFLDLSKKIIIGKLAGYSQPLFSVAIQQSKVTSIVTCGMNEKSYLWFHEYNKELQCQFSNTTNGAIACVRFSGDGERLATCGENGCIEGWSLQNGEKDLTLTISSYPLIHMAWSPDSQHIVVSSLDYIIRIVNFSSGTVTSRVILGEESPTVGVR